MSTPPQGTWVVQVPPSPSLAAVDTTVGEGEARDVIHQAFAAHAPEEIGVSFNGGKDSVVMLYLLLDVIGAERLRALRVFMFSEANEFEEMLRFREATLHALGVKLMVMPEDLGIRGGLQQLHDECGIRAVFLGTRQGDPDGKYQAAAVQRCSAGWPNVVRFCPVFSWTYHMVWAFTQRRGLPVCPLYAMGYTSLGSRLTTHRNSHLAVPAADDNAPTVAVLPAAGGDGAEQKTLPSSSKEPMFRAAWELEDGAWEREGRAKAKAHV